MAVTEPGYREIVKACALAGNAKRWELAHHLLAIDESRVHREWGFRSFRAYAIRELHLGDSKAYAYLTAARMWRVADEAKRVLFEMYSPCTVHKYVPAEARVVKYPGKQKGGARRQISQIPRLTPGIQETVEALCSATTFLMRGIPDHPAVNEWMIRLRQALDAHDRRAKAA